MKTIVLYKSETGFTERYARWIADDLGCEVLPFSKKIIANLTAYDTIIFGSGVIGGMMRGLDSFKKLLVYANKRIVLFATGGTPKTSVSAINRIKAQNLTDRDAENGVHFFFFESGINYQDMSFFTKSMLKLMRRTLQHKTNRTKNEDDMLAMVSVSSDKTNRNDIAPLINYITSSNYQPQIETSKSAPRKKAQQ